MNHKETIKELRKELRWYKNGLIHTIAGEGGRCPKEVKLELEEEYSEFDK